MRIVTNIYSYAFLCLSLLACNTLAHDWINHIQSSLSEAQIKRDVKSMHKDGKTVAQTIEDALREDHAHICAKIKLHLKVPDAVWQSAMAEAQSRTSQLCSILRSKENIHNNAWFISEQEIEALKNPAERTQWNNVRIVAKNALLDFGINPHNIYIHAHDADYLDYLQNAITQEPSWWRRQALKLKRNVHQWSYSFSPLWCSCSIKNEKPQAEIAFNISAMSYFEPVEQKGLFAHELTHILEGHLQEHAILNELETEYGPISKKLWQQYHYSLEYMADQLPALTSINAAKTARDHVHPSMDVFVPRFTNHPLAFYRKRALNTIVRYLEYEQKIHGKQ